MTFAPAIIGGSLLSAVQLSLAEQTRAGVVDRISNVHDLSTSADVITHLPQTSVGHTTPPTDAHTRAHTNEYAEKRSFPPYPAFHTQLAPSPNPNPRDRFAHSPSAPRITSLHFTRPSRGGHTHLWQRAVRRAFCLTCTKYMGIPIGERSSFSQADIETNPRMQFSYHHFDTRGGIFASRMDDHPPRGLWAAILDRGDGINR